MGSIAVYLGVLLEVLLQDDVLSELLVVVLEGRPGIQVRRLREAGHVVLRNWRGQQSNALNGNSDIQSKFGVSKREMQSQLS